MATQPSALSLFPARVPIVDKDGRPSAEFYRALNILFGRVGANGITPGVYGANDKTIVFTIDVYGKVTAIAVLPISITLSQISNLATLTIDANQINDPENIPVTAAQITDPENIPIVAAQITDPANIPIVLAQITDLASLVISYTQVTGLGTMANENIGTSFTGDLAGKTTTIVNGIVTSVV